MNECESGKKEDHLQNERMMNIVYWKQWQSRVKMRWKSIVFSYQCDFDLFWRKREWESSSCQDWIWYDIS